MHRTKTFTHWLKFDISTETVCIVLSVSIWIFESKCFHYFEEFICCLRNFESEFVEPVFADKDTFVTNDCTWLIKTIANTVYSRVLAGIFIIKFCSAVRHHCKHIIYRSKKFLFCQNLETVIAYHEQVRKRVSSTSSVDFCILVRFV